MTKRYELRSGKFGYYYYDTTISIDMTLEMVLNRLNYTHFEIERYKQFINEHLIIINGLNRQINHLNNKLTIKGVLE